MHYKSILLSWLTILLLSPTFLLAQDLIDDRATRKTRNLYQNLYRMSEKRILLGHQDDMAYGVDWNDIRKKSDVKDLTGSYPAVHGWDLGHVRYAKSLDGVSMDQMRKWMKQVYRRGGINTISLHWDNFTTGGNSWDTGSSVKHLLPGGKDHEKYVEELNALADFIQSVSVGFTKVPMIFRPLHEHNGDWFWWGRGSCTEEEYIQLWRFTVGYLKDEKQLHHLIYAFSPDASRMDVDSLKASYLYGYPGDEYVDLLGVDDYWNVGRDINPRNMEEQKEIFQKTLETVSQLAKERGKVAALTETGQEALTNPRWFSEHLLEPISRSESIRISYVLIWRNANTKHHYAPYPGHPAVQDFNDFCKDDRVLLENDLKGMYRRLKISMP